MDALQQLEGIKKRLDKAKEEKATVNGQIIAKIDQLVALGFKKDSPDLIGDVEKKLKSLEKEIKNLEQEFDEGVEDLQKKFPLLFEEE